MSTRFDQFSASASLAQTSTTQHATLSWFIDSSASNNFTLLVIPITNPLILSRIHQIYRVGYIKDVILPRALDAATTANLVSFINEQNVQVVSTLKDDNAFIQELCAKTKSSASSIESKKELMLFLHEFCNAIEGFRLASKQLELLWHFMEKGIFDFVMDALQSEDKSILMAGTDILYLFHDRDPDLLISYALRQEKSHLLGRLVKNLTSELGEDRHCQFLDILYCLLDPQRKPKTDEFVEIFFEKYMDYVIDFIESSCPPQGVPQSVENQALPKPQILSNILELLRFCIRHHFKKTKRKFLLNNAIEKILFLTCRKEKYLVAAAVQVVRLIIAREDRRLLQQIVEKNLLKPVIGAFVRNRYADNLLNSAILGLFALIAKEEKLESLVIYIGLSLSEEFKDCANATIDALQAKYIKCKDNGKRRDRIPVGNPTEEKEERLVDDDQDEDTEWSMDKMVVSAKEIRIADLAPEMDQASTDGCCMIEKQSEEEVVDSKREYLTGQSICMNDGGGWSVNTDESKKETSTRHPEDLAEDDSEITKKKKLDGNREECKKTSSEMTKKQKLDKESDRSDEAMQAQDRLSSGTDSTQHL